MKHRSDFRFLDPLRVRWAEVDMQKIVFNGHYLMYFDTAVAGWWRALAMPYHETMELLKGDLYVRKATLEYEASAHYDEQLVVGVRCARIGTSSITLEAAAFRQEERLVHGELVYVFANPATQKSRPLPQPLRELFEAWEAGEPVFTVRTGSWSELGSDAQRIRNAVFVDEQKIPAPMVVDQADKTAVHAVAYNRFGMALASGRVVLPRDGTGQVGRMATLAPVRGGRLGRAVLDALARAARDRGDRELMLQAQASAVGFYERLGFRPVGEVFQAAGIPHQEMRRTP